jgi:hypothetical protein
MIEFQNESQSLNRQRLEVKQMYSQAAVNPLRAEVSRGEEECELLNTAVLRIQKDIAKVYAQIDRFRFSRVYEEVQDQKQKCFRLSVDLDHLVQEYDHLRTELYLYEDRDFGDIDDDAATIGKLERILTRVRRKHFDACEVLVTLKDKHVREIQDFCGESISPDDSESVLLVSNTSIEPIQHISDHEEGFTPSVIISVEDDGANCT